MPGPGTQTAPHAGGARRPGGWDVRSPSGLIRFYACLLPLAAMLSYYGLAFDTVTVSSQAELARAKFGWPLGWVEQDLSRYQPVEFPATLEYTSQRAWHDPIATSFDWIAFSANTLIFDVAVTACFALLILGLRRPDRKSKP